jgi:hypothetical protein
MWGGAGALATCRALFLRSDSPPGLIAHVSEDPLIALGFEGMRGMDQQHLLTSDGPDPPPASKSQFIDDLRRWLTVMEISDAWPSDAEQSCEWLTGGAPPPASSTAEPTPTGTEVVAPQDEPTLTPAPTSTPTPAPTTAPTSTSTPTATSTPTRVPTGTAVPTPTVEPYWIFILPQVSPSSTSGGALYVSTESDVRSSTTCSFEGGGIGCASSERVQYQKLDGVEYRSKDAALAGLRAQMTECQNRAIVGWYGRTRGQWYGLWNIPNKFSGGPGPVCP